MSCKHCGHPYCYESNTIRFCCNCNRRWEEQMDYTTEQVEKEVGLHNKQEKKEAVHHPAHYNTGKIEVIDFIEDQQLGFHEGNVVKYICRAKHKETEIQDLKKAFWYLERRLLVLQGVEFFTHETNK